MSNHCSQTNWSNARGADRGPAITEQVSGGWEDCSCKDGSTWSCKNNRALYPTGSCCERQRGVMCTDSSKVATTRGVPSKGSREYGPRGQRQEFSNFIPAPNCYGNCPNPQAIYYQPLVGGPPCPPSHPNSQMPNCAPPPPPPPPNPQAPGITITFTTNMMNGYNRGGCSFLYNRHSALSQRLAGLQQAGTNPLWQQMLQNRISYINNLVMSNCTGGPTPGPTGGTPPPPGYGSNNPNNPTNPALNYATNMGISQAPQVHTMGY